MPHDILGMMNINAGWWVRFLLCGWIGGLLVWCDTRLQSMACAHQRYIPPKTVAHQVYLGVENQMGLTGCGPTKLFNNQSYRIT